MILRVLFEFARLLFYCVYIIWSVVPRLIRWVVGLFSKGQDALQNGRANGKEESKSDIVLTEKADSAEGGENLNRAKPCKSWLANYYPELVTAVLTVWFLTAVFDYMGGPTDAEKRELPKKTIAVLPFEEVSGWDSDDSLAYKIAEDLLLSLTEIPELKVAGKSASLNGRYTSSNWNWGRRELQSSLDVNFVVAGEIGVKGDQVQITVQLHPVNNRHIHMLWEGTFVGGHEDIPANLASIRAAVLVALQIESESN